MLATVALDIKCFSLIQAQPHSWEGKKRCRDVAAVFTQPCAGSEIGHYIDLNRFLVCMNSPVREKKTTFPLHGFILIFIVALHTESTNVTENGLDICSHSPLFLSLHPSFSTSLFPLLCSSSPDAWCLLLPERKKNQTG